MNNLINLLSLATRQLRRDWLADEPKSCEHFTSDMVNWLTYQRDMLTANVFTEEQVIISIRKKAIDWTWSQENEIDFPTLANLRKFAFDYLILDGVDA